MTAAANPPIPACREGKPMVVPPPWRHARVAGAAPADAAPLAGVGGAGCVLLGEATHGTSEFYAERARITRRLIEDHGFQAVAVEADWPDAYRAGRWARGGDEDPDALAALGDFTRFP